MKKHKTAEADQNATDSGSIAIVGIGCLFPQANDVETFWGNIKNGADAITDLPETHWKAADFYNSDPKAADQVYANKGGFLSPIDFNPMHFGVLPNALEAIDTSQLLGMVAVEQALKDAGYDMTREFDRDKVSVILGVTGALELVIPLGARLGHPRWREALKDAGVDDEVAEDAIRRISDSYVPWQENSFPGLLGNVVAGRISRHFNFGGTNCVVDAACGSSLSALSLAALELNAGKADMVVTGGIDTFNDIFMYTCFSKTPALSPSGHARPFDADADGTTLGEGIGIVVLKRLDDAVRDGDKIYAVIRGIGSSSDGRGAAIYEPNAAGQEKAVQRAYQQAGIAPETIGLIEAHGTGTKVGDAVEIKGLRNVFGEAEAPYCAIGSIKSQIGHTKAAAGSAGLIKAALALYHKTLPPTIKVNHPSQALTSGKTPFYLNNQARPWAPQQEHPRRAGVSALGFGGSNFHCLLEEYRPEKPLRDWMGDIQIAVFGAADQQGLAAALERFKADDDWQELRQAAAQSRRDFDAQQPCRLALVISRDKTKRAAQLKNALTLLQKNRDQNQWHSPDGIFFAAGETGPAAILFPGQGAQYPGMLKDLALQFPVFFTAIEAADRIFSAQSGPSAGRLTGLIYPQPGFDTEQRAMDDAKLRDTEVAQPALGAVSLGALDVLAGFGFEAEAYAGHSYGELTALCAGGYFDRETLHSLSRLRGALMSAGDGDRGSMLAVSAPIAEIEQLLDEQQLDLVLANRNTPGQGVLSGSTAEIQKASALLEERGLRGKQLSVAAAFHSKLVADAAKPFAEKLQAITFTDPVAAVYSNTSGGAYPKSAAAAKKLLASQLASPVDFISEIENMYQAGLRTFVEVGPGARLTGMVKAILDGRDHQAFSIDSSNGQRSGIQDLAQVIAQLAVAGHPLDLAMWDEGFLEKTERDSKKKSGLTVPICGANHFVPPAKRPAVAPQTPNQASKVAPAAAASASRPVERKENFQTDSSRGMQETLRITQQSLQSLQNLQQQTAELHKKFLEGQEAATRSFLSLIEQQHQVLQGDPVQVAASVMGEAAQQTSTPTPTSQPAEVSTDVAPAPAPAATASPAPAVDSQRISTVLLEVIAEKTGYPVDMLELEMALDADLGIDSIKRVEILSALQEQLPELPEVKPEELGVLQTLGQIVAHLGASDAPAPAAAASKAPAVDSQRISTVLLEVIAEKTGYPVDMLELEMALDADLGIDSIKRVEILSALQEQLPELPAVKPEELGVLQTLGQIVAHLGASDAPAPAAAASKAPAVDSQRISTVLLEVIAEKTGYPVDMLELEMALDADLGIDSIKRVEILSALQEQLPELPAVKPEELGVLQTLGQIVAHLGASDAPAPAAAASKAPAVDSQRISTVLLEVIAEKTGYPVDMLELEMALDADLGIDSIKRVEILSALQEQLPELPAVKPEELGVLQTLGQIVAHLAADSRPTAAAPGAVQRSSIDRTAVSSTLLKVIAEKTGYPVDMLELEMALDADLGIDSIKRVEILSALQEQLPAVPAIKPEHLGTLQTVGQIVDFLASVSGAGVDSLSSRPVLDSVQAGEGIERKILKVVPLQANNRRAGFSLAKDTPVWVSEDGSELTDAVCRQLSARQLKPVRVSVTALDDLPVPRTLGGLVLLSPAQGSDDRFLTNAFRLMQKAADPLLEASRSGDAVFATVSRLNGSFGLMPGAALLDPVSGGLAGLSKTAAHEWPAVHCKAFDLADNLDDLEQTASLLVDELLVAGPVEVGICAQGLQMLKLSGAGLPDEELPLPLAVGDLVVISGGARGVTAEIAVALASSCRANLLLLGRSKLPGAEPEWLSGLSSEAEIKKQLAAHAQASLKPRELEEQYQQVLGNREIDNNLRRIREAGGEAIYRSVDLRDEAAVAAAVNEVRASHGPVKGLIHGAGVLADRLIADKTVSQFETVYSTKVAGLRSLLAAVAEDELKFMALFSSSTGRFGRTGQVDYAVANEVLNKLAQQEARLRPECRVLALNWGPWDGGMVTPALKKLFEQEGVQVIDLRAGADYLLKELSTASGGPVELVILGSHNEAHVDSQPQPHPNIYVSRAFDLELSIDQYPFLKSHVIDTKAVLPMAMITEWMAHGAIHNNPGLKFHGFNDLRILKGVSLENGQLHSLQVMTGKAFKSDGFHVVPVELSGTDQDGQHFVHSRAKIVLANKLPEGKAPGNALTLPVYPHPVEELYRPERLFHGPDFHSIREVVGCSADGVTSLVRPAPLPAEWITQPLRNTWLADPLVLDSAFQMMILWSFEKYRAGSLPVFAGRYRQYAERFPENGAEIRIRVLRQNASKAVAEIEFLDPDSGRLIARMENYECVIDASLNESFQRNKLQGAA